MNLKFGESISLDAAGQLANIDRAVSRWPSRDVGNRLEPIFAPSLRPRFRIDPRAQIFTIG